MLGSGIAFGGLLLLSVVSMILLGLCYVSKKEAPKVDLTTEGKKINNPEFTKREEK